jgi:hypothetical protein
MPPTPTPTEPQINKTREAAGENSSAFVAAIVDTLNDSEWLRVLELITEWDEYPAGDTVELEGGSDGLRYSSNTARGDIRIRLRLLLGLPEFRDSDLTGIHGSIVLENQFVF